ncbi:HET-domain-containing protein [Ophiobolus disseminans]|uniref:HET-domain-containing protein n=1 Tax=Ophiobolus disseminans TaxID=1469910 RepID=A0A6A6ZR04_9PLEO|nr:HET-domain-containing protein [Ophiobolus disseminans]
MPACRHPDIRNFDDVRCCLACGEAVFENTSHPEQTADLSETSTYQYKRLNYELGQEIRLIILYPGEILDDIRCSLVHVNLLDKPTFEAVSYTWATANGDASLSAQMICHGRRIFITRNCERVLRCLRSLAHNRTLWIDAVCINQMDNTERSHQVNLMDTVYSNASLVLAYVGAENVNIQRLIAQFMRQPANDLDARLVGQADNFHQDYSYRDRVTTFLSQPYFDRVWVLQEIALAKVVIMVTGQRTMEWTAETASVLLQLCRSFCIDPPSVLRWPPANGIEKEDILDVLRRSRNCSASNPRDKIYAVLGLVKQDGSSLIPVDYSRSPNEVFEDLAVYLLKQKGRLDVLLHAANQRLDTDSVPSWVPQWDVKCAYEPLPPQFDPLTIEEISGQWFWPPPRSVCCSFVEKHWSNQRALYGDNGFTFDICQRKLPPGSSKSHPLSLPYLKIRGHRLDTIAQIPQGPPVKYHFPEKYFTCSEHSSQGLCRPSWYDGEYIYLEAVRDELGVGKTHFITEQSVGFAQEWQCRGKLRSGDTVWALAGLNVPVILRKAEEHYVLMGECYLYRAMMPLVCTFCRMETQPWSMVTEVIDIW